MSYQDPYAPQDVYAQQQQLGKGDEYNTPPAYTQPDAYAQTGQQPYAQPGTYPPFAQQSYTQPGAYQQPYAQPGVYPPPAQSNYVRSALRMGNPWANAAMYSGIISIILASLTFFSQIGFAGLITGIFAIYRGMRALSRSQQVPGSPGRTKALLAIVLGVLALVLIFASFALRGSGS
jgi:hypothetical protein